MTSVLHFGRPRFDLPDDARLAAAAVAAALFASANALGLPDNTFFGDTAVAVSIAFLTTLPFGRGLLVCSIDVDGGDATVCNGDDDGVSVNVVGIDFFEPVNCLLPDR